VDHAGAEVGVFFEMLWGARVMRIDTFRFRRETIRQRHVERLERRHHAIDGKLGVMRLFRQLEEGNWTAVLDEVGSALIRIYNL
jgi:hypothetical protein